MGGGYEVNRVEKETLEGSREGEEREGIKEGIKKGWKNCIREGRKERGEGEMNGRKKSN